MKKLDLLYEGKAKKVYTTDNEDYLIVDYKDDATAFNGEKKGTISGKGVINNRVSNHLFKMLAEKGIENHFVEELSDRETVVKKVEIVPLEETLRQAAFQNATALKRAESSCAPHWSFPIKMTLWATRLLTRIMQRHWVLQQMRKSKKSAIWHSLSINF